MEEWYGLIWKFLLTSIIIPNSAQENACLSFLTPSRQKKCGEHRIITHVLFYYAALITGDRTLVNVVVHELTHSWFGNGIT